MLLLAIEMLLLHRAYFEGRRRALYGTGSTLSRLGEPGRLVLHGTADPGRGRPLVGFSMASLAAALLMSFRGLLG